VSQTYETDCFNCLSQFDAIEAVWCSCNPHRPTKVCPFCMGCFCAAGDEFRETFWKTAPPVLAEERKTLAESRMLIGDLLVRAGAINTTQLLDALKIQKQNGKRLGEILVDTGAVDAHRLETLLHSQHTVIPVDLSRARIDAMLLRRLGIEECLRDRIVPLEAESFRDRYIMTLVMADPSNTALLDRIQKETGCQAIPAVAPADAIQQAIRAIFPEGVEVQAEPVISNVRRPDTIVDDPLCQKLLMVAIRRRASHLHIFERAGEPALHYRIDGSLFHDRSCSPRDTAAARDAFRKIADLDVRGSPPAGRGILPWRGLEYGLIIRHRSGPQGSEQFSVKLLDPIGFPPQLDEIGLPTELVDAVRESLKRETGLIIVSSPPWSGGSSTTWGLAMDILSQDRSLALLESPCALRLEGTTQEEFWPERPDTFGPALERVIEAGARVLAVTSAGGLGWVRSHPRLPRGRLVIGRVEAAGLVEALGILMTIGFPPEALEKNKTFILHQTLLRKLCPSCRVEELLTSIETGPEGLRRAATPRFHRGPGCAVCGPTPGVRGRYPVAHALEVTAEIAAALATEDRAALMKACRQAGLRSLREVAEAAIAEGLVDEEEIAPRPRAASGTGSKPASQA